MRNVRLRAVIFVFALATALVVGIAPAAQADPTADPRKPQATETVAPKDYNGWVVEHWGPGWSSGPLDASIASNRDPQNFVTEKESESPSQAASVGFSCSLYVGSVVVSGSSKVAGTGQTCTGAFSEKFVVIQFQRKNLVGIWVNYSLSAESAHTTDATDDLTWTMPCTSGSNWYYRLIGRAYARSSEDGTLHNGGIIDGNQSGKFACGT